jgi:ABC-type Zn uptake system ZnuABC Zn-binding protein ZnuA
LINLWFSYISDYFLKTKNNIFYSDMTSRIKFFLTFWIIVLIVFSLAACKYKDSPLLPGNLSEEKNREAVDTIITGGQGIKSALAVETFLADIAQNITGSRLVIYSLMPIGLDPHEFEPVPGDFAKISKNKVLIINGSGFEGWLEKIIKNAGSNNYIIEASKGIGNKTELQSENTPVDPHFWLDPVYAIEYVKNIKDELIKIDPGGKDIYELNSQNYTARLIELNNWIKDTVSILPENKRLIATNHESLGYFAKRYGFKIAGTIIPGFSTDASITAREFAELIKIVRSSGVKVIFLETGSNPNLAEQLAAETGIKVVYDLYTHSLSGPGGEAATYIDMMKFNVNTIVNNLQ